MKRKKFQALSDRQKTQAVRELDREFVADSFRPLTAAERLRWRRIKRKPGRPRQGRGVKIVSVSVEKDLLKQSDALAKRLGISRAGLIARGLKRELAGAAHRG